MTSILISDQRYLQCPRCELAAKVGINIDAGSLPIVIKCMNCSFILTLKSEAEVKVLPKVDMSAAKQNKVVPGWNVFDSDLHNLTLMAASSDAAATENPFQESRKFLPEKNEDSETSDDEISTGNHETENKPGFYSKADSLLSILSSARSIADSITSDVNELANAMHTDFSEYAEAVGFYAKDIDLIRCREFMKNPFATICVDGLPDSLGIYSRWIIMPSCFRKIIGFPVCDLGPWQLQIVTPYSLLTFPVETWHKRVMDNQAALLLPDPPALSVVGDKIIGRDLYAYWKLIPGICEDEDHTRDVPSVLMVDKMSACKWLACHYILPVQANPVSKQEMYPNHNILELMEKRRFHEAFQEFCVNGRLFLAWPEFSELASFFSYFVYVIRGTKLIIAKDEDHVTEFRLAMNAGYNIGKENQSASFNFNITETAFITQEQIFCNPEVIYTASCIIVPEVEKLDLSVLRLLYGYNGRMIICGKNPMLDTLEENELASAVYGLCGKVNIPHTRRLPVANSVGSYRATYKFLQKLAEMSISTREEYK